jgi:hypothetical protein
MLLSITTFSIAINEILSVIMLNVVLISVVMLIAMAPPKPKVTMKKFYNIGPSTPWISIPSIRLIRFHPAFVLTTPTLSILPKPV